MKKIRILLLICLFCAGCQAKYNLQINEDMTVTEEITGLETQSFYDEYYNSTKERVISFMTETKNDYLNNLGYSKAYVSYDNLSGAKYSTTFATLEDYFENSEAYTQFYDTWDYSIKNGVVTLSLKNQLLRNEDSITRYVIDNCEVTIILPFKVKKSNADYVDKGNNKYTWELNDKEGKNIYIKFDTNQMSDNKDLSSVYIIISILVVLVSIFLIYLYLKIKSNNNL